MWLHLPRSIASACAPEPADWTSPCNWPLNSSAGSRELFVTLSGKPTPRPLSWRGWKTRPWMMRLSGMTFAPSTASLGVEAWIASLPATPASLSVAPANNWLNSIRATFGPRWIASLAKRNLGSSSSKMLTLTFDWVSEVSAEISKEEATLLRLDCSQRQKLGQAMSAKGSPSWPTADALAVKRDNQSDSPNAALRPTLAKLVEKWPTPNSAPEAPNNGLNRGNGIERARNKTQCLGEAARALWPTAKAGETGGYQRDNGTKGKERPNLTGLSKQWSTPRSSANENRTTKHAPSHGHGHGRTLAGDAMTANWPTPASRDFKGTNDVAHLENGTGRLHLDQLPNFVKFHFSHPAPATLTDGGTSSPETPSSPRRLNPRFVEWLMGWPVGWTDCASPVTGLSLWKSRMRSSLWRLLKQWDSDL